MKDILFFDSMITPKIITIVYWLLLISVVASGLGIMVSGHGIFYGLLTIVGGTVSVRIFCELTIVLFKVNENLKTIAAK